MKKPKAKVRRLKVGLGDAIAKKAAQVMKKAGLKLDDLLKELHRQRTRYNRERNGA